MLIFDLLLERSLSFYLCLLHTSLAKTDENMKKVKRIFNILQIDICFFLLIMRMKGFHFFWEQEKRECLFQQASFKKQSDFRYEHFVTLIFQGSFTFPFTDFGSHVYLNYSFYLRFEQTTSQLVNDFNRPFLFFFRELTFWRRHLDMDVSSLTSKPLR